MLACFLFGHQFFVRSLDIRGNMPYNLTIRKRQLLRIVSSVSEAFPDKRPVSWIPVGFRVLTASFGFALTESFSIDYYFPQ